jgi:hypothetical protein
MSLLLPKPGSARIKGLTERSEIGHGVRSLKCFLGFHARYVPTRFGTGNRRTESKSRIAV